ncbi:hypothetical protein [Vibrio hangzhouensis]|uniref:hypothetical protein n=1 Tax=Vibrio hangzhouensis TaxID=462991 RepID=UPI001C961ED4|nr:hypothetical protein [Vibrio hangzhouensis]MBY6196857.1 hypothetical protein [Vibrio hangzhouensis]
MKLVTKDLTQTKQWLSEPERKAIVGIIESSFSNITPDAYLAKYFDSSDAFERRLRLYFDEGKVVGYCLLTFSDESTMTVIRASAGFIPKYRKGGNTFQFSLSESFKCWLRRPWKKIYYADTMLSPAMYRAIAKNTGIIWPHPQHPTSGEIFDVFNPNGELGSGEAVRCLVPVNRVSNYSESELKSFETSDKLEIQYYCKLNPDFNKGVALFVIIPISFRQFVKTALKKLRA